jgi:5,5'-dehydrodivanillate O-demethylase
METVENNEMMTRVGKGTPGGELLRRYWHPIAAAVELEDNPTKKIRLLGEDLVLFRDKQGRPGLIEEHCPHRRASLVYGFATEQGLRCPYHGWEFDAKGACVNQPFEKAASFKDTIRVNGYPVEELGGLIFAYLGPLPAPLLPRYDGYVAEGTIKALGHAVIPCNWLQIVETSADPVHAEWLHGRYIEYQNEKEGLTNHISAGHDKIDFREFEYGMTKHRLMVGQPEDSDDWKVGHPLVFPTTLAVGNGDADRRSYAFQLRVPMDDENTMHFWFHAYAPPAGAQVPPRLFERIHMHEVPFKGENGRYRTDHIDGQDIMAWLTQGRIADRTAEKLGASDIGILTYRRILKREIKKVQRGEDPIGVIRDPAKNVRIDLPNEKNKKHFRGSFRTFLSRTHMRFSPIAEDLGLVFEP